MIGGDTAGKLDDWLPELLMTCGDEMCPDGDIIRFCGNTGNT